MEVYFADVGQGTSNIILLGKRRAIVIDAGKRASDLRLLLHGLCVDRIELLALSHLDDDHSGGAPAILTEFRGRIGPVCYPNDHRALTTPFWERVAAEVKAGYLDTRQLLRMECEDTPKALWRSRASQAELKLFSPTFGENQDAIRREDTNATSGILVLKVGDNRIVFPGDSPLAQWRGVRERRGAALDCEVLAVPHHAGVIWPGHWDDARVAAELAWLYRDAVRPRLAVISVGTSNADKHPREEVIAALRATGAAVICTQITTKCCADPEAVRPGLLPLTLPGRSSPDKSLTTSGNSKDVACAGTVAVDITAAAVAVRRMATHQAAVDALKASSPPVPLCRR